MDLVVLRRLVDELADRLVNQRIDQVYAIPRLDIALVVGKRRAPRLWFSADPDDPHVYLRPPGHPTPRRPPGFAMAARKWLRGQRITRLGLIEGDRVVELEATGPGARLVFELLPRRACAFVVEPDDRVAAVWSPKKGRPGPGDQYTPPSRRPRTPAGEIDGETWQGLADLDSERELVSSLLRSVAGMTRLLAQEIAARRETAPLPELVRSELKRASEAPADPRLYAPAPLQELRILPRPSRFLLAPYPLVQAEELTATPFPDLTSAAARYYLRRARLGRLEATRKAVVREVRGRLDSLERARSRIREQQPDPGQADRLRRVGDTLLASPDAELADGRARIPDVYSDGELIDVPVDSSRTPVENAQRYYHKAKRMERRLKHGRSRLRRLRAESEELERLRDHAAQLVTLEDCDALVRQAIDAGLEVDAQALRDPEAEVRDRREEARTGSEDRGQSLPGGVRGYRTTDGHEILVGSSARGNDRLTHEIAAREDWWLHAEGPGSHVILRNPTRADTPPQGALSTAATVAAYFSKARDATKVEVRWTRAKNIKRPKGGPPGAALLDSYQTHLVKPISPADLNLEPM